MNLNYLIVAPKFVPNKGDYYFFPLGLTYISAALKKYGFSVNTINLNHYNDKSINLIRSIISAKKIDVVCVGGLSASFHQIKDVVRIARDTKPLIKVIIGGGIFSSEPELMMNALDADIGIFYEGEESIVEVAQHLKAEKDLGKVDGIIFRDPEDHLIKTGPRSAIKNLDLLPFPDYDGFNLAEYLDQQKTSDFFTTNLFDSPRSMPMITSRSCPYKCTFCYHPIGTQYRQRTLNNFFDELSMVVDKYGITTVEIMDELFSHNIDRVNEFCRRIKPFNLKWVVQLRVEDVSREMVQLMRDSGCFLISFGIESASNEVLKSMKKKITVEQITRALKIVHEEKVAIQGNLIFGDVAENEKTLEESFNWWKKYPQYNVNLSMIQTYPGSKIFEYAVDKGLIKDKLKYIADGNPYINLTQLSDRTYKTIFKKIKNLQNRGAKGQIIYRKTQLSKDSSGNPLCELKVLCPHCDEMITYKNIAQDAYRVYIDKIYCRNCYRSMLLVQRKYKYHQGVKDFLRKFTLLKNISTNRKLRATVKNVFKI